jgi:hypothetical protein
MSFDSSGDRSRGVSSVFDIQPQKLSACEKFRKRKQPRRWLGTTP